MSSNSKGRHSLQAIFPGLSQEWDTPKNEGLKPDAVTPGSGKIVWWNCSKGHSYQARVAHRTREKSSCSVCANRVVIEGINDLATTHPALALEFDRAKNLPLSPSQVLAGAKQKYWWICPKNHSYEAAGYSRKNGTQCPYCANKLTLTGYNDLMTTFPELAEEFDLVKNHPATPKTLQAGHNQKVWWTCLVGHSFQASPLKRTSRQDGCPYCSGRRTISGFNDMGTLQPSLLEHFHPTKNGYNNPANLAPKSSRKLWWICEKGHEYQATAKNRLQPAGLGCPVCSNHKVLPGFNDLGTTRPDVAKSWDYTRNGNTTPSSVIGGSNKKYWWVCEKGHQWYAFVSLRTRGRNCPRCSKGGYDATKPGWIYFIQSETLGAYKVGISNSEFRRLSQYEDHWKVIRVWNHGEGRIVAEIESAALRWIRKELGLPPYLSKAEMGSAGGASETFSSEEISESEVITFIDGQFRSASSET